MSEIIKTCIICPKGCQLKITEIDKEKRIIEVTDNQCRRGAVYAKEEMYNPKRTLQTTVKTVFKDFERLPVKTSESIPKELIFDVMELAKKVVIEEQMRVGDVVIENLLDTGVDLVATANIQT